MFNNAPVFQKTNGNFGVPDFGGTVGVTAISIDYTDTSAKVEDGARLPKNAVPVHVMVSISTDFDAGTSNDLEIGIESDPDYFATALDIGTVGNFLPDATGFVAGRYGVKLTQEEKLSVKFTPAGTAATQGEANIIIFYYIAGDTVLIP
jgi:hypothetical protein